MNTFTNYLQHLFIQCKNDVLPPFEWEKKEPYFKAMHALMYIANHLGVIVLSKANRELFFKKEVNFVNWKKA
jgi:hypothetical protein